MASNRAAAMEMVRISGQQGVPVTVIDGKAVVGFDRPRDQLLAWAQRPRLGAALADAADMAAKGARRSPRRLRRRVSPDGAAAGAGLQPGDVITAIARQPIGSAAAVERVIARVRRGQAVPLTYVRAGRSHEVMIQF